MIVGTSLTLSLPWTSPFTTATGARPQQPRQRTASTENSGSVEADPELALECLDDVVAAAQVAGGAEAYLDDVLAGLLQLEEVVEGDDAVDLRQWNVQQPGDLQRDVARDVSEGLLHLVQDHDQVAWLVLPLGDERLEFGRQLFSLFAHHCFPSVVGCNKTAKRVFDNGLTLWEKVKEMPRPI